jgi:murein DD-endopeptidase MepM/ murein hydrolase activator NlpD
MFPLKDRKIIGYAFGQPTFYSSFHLGTDYMANYNKLFAPFDGVVTTSVGPSGGKTIQFKPTNQNVVIRFLHLEQFIKTGFVKEGELIARTGNTGVSTGPHLHLDISKDSFQINNLNNFIDPEKFNWGGELMNQAKVVKSKNNATIYICYPIPNMDYLHTKASMEGINIPTEIPTTDSL